MIHVYHAVNPTFFPKKDFRYSPSEFVLVATVDTDSKSVAFAKTNNVEWSWTQNDGVTFYADNLPEGSPTDGCRSTSVGDVLHVGDKLFLVDMIGFREITQWDHSRVGGDPNEQTKAEWLSDFDALCATE